MSEIKNVNLNTTASDDFLNYASEVIKQRAIPNIEDNLKPVHRRILYTMYNTKLTSDKKEKKSAATVGEVMKIHPHGDTSIYDALVRLSQEWKMRYPLISVQGNKGNINGSSAAAMRYCVVGDTLVLTENGWQEIASISEGTDTKIDLKVKSINGYNQADKFFNSGIHQTIEIITRAGYKIKGTYNHPILILNPTSLKKEWKLIENLQKEDLILIDIKESNALFGKRDNLIEAAALGSLISEGYITTQNRQGVINKDIDMINPIFQWFNELDSVQNNKIRFRESDQAYEFTVASKTIHQTLIKDFEYSNFSENKIIPKKVLQGSKEYQQEFLKYLFEGDGGVLNNIYEVNYTSRSLKLIQQIQIMLTQFGIFSSITRTKRKSSIENKLHISSESIIKYQKNIGFVSERKNKELQAIVDVYNNRETIANNSYHNFSFINRWLENRTTTNYRKTKGSLSNIKAFKKNSYKYDRLKQEELDIIYDLLTNYRAVNISEINKTGPETVYSIRVNSECHSFISNGIVSHNTEAKLSPIGDLMVQELKESSVGMMETYDGEGLEPMTTPSAFPNILCNGNMGIAVGMSSSILPHNLREAVAALSLMIDNENVSLDEVLKVMPGPDFPTGGTITNISNIREVYESGSGSVALEAKYTIEKKGSASHIVVTEVPYLVDIEKIMSKIKKLALDGEIDDVVDIQNNTGRSGVELRIILRPKANINRTLQKLLADGGLRTTVRVGMTVLEDFKPIQTNMLGLMRGFLKHRHDVLIRIHQERKQKSEDRLHIVEGLIIASEDIDNVIALIKSSENKNAARMALSEKYNLSVEQSNAILDMKLSRLTKIDSLDLINEKNNLINLIKKYIEIIDNKNKRNDIIKADLIQINKNFGDARRTTLKNIENEEIKRPEINFAIGLFENNEIDIVEMDKIWAGSKNRIGKKIFENIPKQIIQFNSKNSLLAFDQEGKVTEISGDRISEGHYLFYDIDSRVKDNIVFITELKEEDKAKEFLVTITKDNLVKKTLLSEYNNFRSTVFAAKIKEKDEIIYAGLANDEDFIVVLGENHINKYLVSSLRPTGRATQGVKASAYKSVLAATIVNNNDKIILLDKQGEVKSFLGHDIQEGTRTIKGQTTSPDNDKIYKVNGSNIILYGMDNRGYQIDINEIETKALKNMNHKVYNGKLKKLGV